jgi:hypothetical protein
VLVAAGVFIVTIGLLKFFQIKAAIAQGAVAAAARGRVDRGRARRAVADGPESDRQCGGPRRHRERGSAGHIEGIEFDSASP